MSKEVFRNGFRSSLFFLKSDPDEIDLDNEEEITELDLSLDDCFRDFLGRYKRAVCDCGGKKVKTTCVYWCSAYQEHK